MERSKIVIIIPALNEEKTISKIVKECRKYGKVIVVNDGSKDNTAFLAREAGAFVINNSKNLGYEKSLNRGFKLASKKNI